VVFIHTKRRGKLPPASGSHLSPPFDSHLSYFTVHLLRMPDPIMYQILAEQNDRHHPKYPLIMHQNLAFLSTVDYEQVYCI